MDDSLELSLIVIPLLKLKKIYYFIYFLKDFIYLLLERGRETSMCGLLLVHPLLGTWPATQARALSGNRTSDLSVSRLALNSLSHTTQGNLFLN